MPEALAMIPCAGCARRAENPQSPQWRDLLARLDLGHDQAAHRVYWALVQHGVTAGALAQMSDEQLLGWPNFGVGMLERIRTRVPARTGAAGSRRVLKPCGTPAAYKRHVRHGEEPCDACREAERARRRAPGAMPFRSARCGTRSGYNRHRRLREPICAACRAANAKEARLGRMRRAQSRPEQIPHGFGGFVNWDCRCEVCTTANAVRSADYRASRRKQAQR